ncbi:putative nitrilase [Macrophomina phaseolina]|uniref:nitrilase n=1 Tax=Macrophomina phaseolina TaxID=35725 RepID=A0ABQ8GFE6_9PEZI|nr:putative nitrilase [Macrophomina phaseolina]
MADAKASTTIKVAVTQAEPEWLDLEKAVQKTCALIDEAAANGAKLISFPEVWITGYPAWIWSRPVDFDLTSQYIKNSLRVPSPELSTIQASAAANSIAVVLGFSENHENSIYIAQAIISPQGELLTHRRKIKPTHMERTLFGDAAGGSNTLHNTATVNLSSTTSPTTVSSLACWEHAQPLLKYHTALQRPHLHVAAWPPITPHGGPADPTLWSMSREGCRTLSRAFAIEAQCYVLHTSTVLTAKGIEAMGTAGAPIMGAAGGGCSCVFGPDGREVSEEGALGGDEEGIVYAECDVEGAVLKAKGFLDLGGHYSRPDILWLGVDAGEKAHVVEGKGRRDAA